MCTRNVSCTLFNCKEKKSETSHVLLSSHFYSFTHCGVTALIKQNCQILAVPSRILSRYETIVLPNYVLLLFLTCCLTHVSISLLKNDNSHNLLNLMLFQTFMTFFIPWNFFFFFLSGSKTTLQPTDFNFMGKKD